jgi:hypothetical protein
MIAIVVIAFALTVVHAVFELDRLSKTPTPGLYPVYHTSVEKNSAIEITD